VLHYQVLQPEVARALRTASRERSRRLLSPRLSPPVVVSRSRCGPSSPTTASRATYVSKDVTNHCYQDLQSAKSVSDPGQVSATTPHASGEGLSTGMPPGMKRQAPPSIPSKTCPHVLLLPNFVAPAAACDAAGAYSMDMTAVRHATASALRCAQPKC
jgi:hypothetical protein